MLPPKNGKCQCRDFIHVYDGITLLDETGIELPDLTFARREAIRYAATLLETAGKRDSLGQEWRMEVTDSEGLMMFRLDFVVTDSPAAASASNKNPSVALSSVHRIFSCRHPPCPTGWHRPVGDKQQPRGFEY